MTARSIRSSDGELPSARGDDRRGDVDRQRRSGCSQQTDGGAEDQRPCQEPERESGRHCGEKVEGEQQGARSDERSDHMSDE